MCYIWYPYQQHWLFICYQLYKYACQNGWSRENFSYSMSDYHTNYWFLYSCVDQSHINNWSKLQSQWFLILFSRSVWIPILSFSLCQRQRDFLCCTCVNRVSIASVRLLLTIPYAAIYSIASYLYNNTQRQYSY